MMQIRSLFDPAKDIYRAIEKVITYATSQEDRLRSEITEYVVTDSIEENLEDLLSKMQLTMDAGGEHEVGVWVSGFYGSGKSSFTKYLGLALDGHTKVAGELFLKHLQDRLKKPTTRALLGTIAARFKPAVVLLDLASEMLAGATMEDVSTVLYYKVLQWAGYSRNLKVAALERKLKKDGRYDEFTALVRTSLDGAEWRTVQNDPLVVDSLVPDLAHRMYPSQFTTPAAFTTESRDIVRFENERVSEMLDIVRETTGKQFILFIVDEVGQYVASRPNLILNLDGLAKNLKGIGDGKAWIFGTAQQTLTEDDPRAAFNSPALFKLKDRFPIQIDLEAHDIKEICVRRLLAKGLEGAKELRRWFGLHGQALRHHAKLEEAKSYVADFDEATFVDLYPFLPAHFDILLNLLAQLARSTGGLGLRSAIKVIQDVLVEGAGKQPPLAEQPVGTLATTVILYDALEKDIRRAFGSIHQAVGLVVTRFSDSAIHQDVAKTVAVLQVLANLPATYQNVAAVMHGAVDAAPRRDAVEAAARELIADKYVPLGEENGALKFYSEKLNEIEQERLQIPLRTVEITRILGEALRSAYEPLPTVRLQGSLSVTTGLKAAMGSVPVALAGEREPIQTVVEFVAPADYDAARARLVDESRQKASAAVIFLLARTTDDVRDKAAEIFRCAAIAEKYKSDPDAEVRDYCRSQTDRAARLAMELQQIRRRSLSQGSFIFHIEATAVETLGADPLEAARKHLEGVAAQVFDRYAEAPVRAETSLAEKFLRAGGLASVTSAIDPLGLVQMSGGVPKIRTDHKALVSIRDYLHRNGSSDGKRLIDHFTDPPFGWSQDTLEELTQDEKARSLASLDATEITPSPDLTGLRQLINQEYVIATVAADQRKQVERLGRERRLERLRRLKEEADKQGKKSYVTSVSVPVRLRDRAALDALIARLQKVRADLDLYAEIDVTLKLND
jgi:hypothetical protein